MRTPELSGVAIVCAGSFNPAIVHPSWLAEKELISADLAKYVVREGEDKQLVVSSQLTQFVADWLTVQITQHQLLLATVDRGREMDLRDLAKGLFDSLPDTPIDAIGINADSHFRAEDETAWHEFGDRFLPKDFWEPLFGQGPWRERSEGKRVGMRAMTVEVTRDPEVPGHVRVELAPSVRIAPHGIYIGINAHFQLTLAGRRADAGDAARVLATQWEVSRTLESHILAQLGKAI